LTLQHGPVATVMTVHARPVGTEKSVQSIILYNDIKRIDFALDIDKSPSGHNSMHGSHGAHGRIGREAMFVALPFSIPNYRFHHELPGGVVEPAKDLFEGSNTAYYTVRHFSDVSNEDYGVTVSSIESPYIEYDHPRADLMLVGWPGEGEFEKDTNVYPRNSRMYLYLLNNMFDTNIRWDQRGPVKFTWSIRSHKGNWKEGKADQFGWDVHNPLLTRVVKGRQDGVLPSEYSFMSINKANVICTAIKPAEANSQGLILRCHETTGKETTAKVTLPFFGRITSARETSLVEEDRDPLELKGENAFAFKIRPFGVKTVRVIRDPGKPLLPPTYLSAGAEADMQVKLNWKSKATADRIGHFNIYRDTNKKCEPTLINYLGQTAVTQFTDEPALNHGGWIRNTLEPDTTYYYRVVAIDRYNNVGRPSETAKVTTLKSGRKNLEPLQVVGLKAIQVSPISSHNFVNLIWRSNCESDIAYYEIHRSTYPEFSSANDTLISKVDNNEVIKGSAAYGHTMTDYLVKDFDHSMFADMSAKPKKTYYYKVCAVDSARQKGAFSKEAVVTTKPTSSILDKLHFSAQSSASSTHGTAKTIDGQFETSYYGPTKAADGPRYYGEWGEMWVSKQYGGGTKQNPLDVWWEAKFPEAIKIKGVKKIGDDRTIIPILKNFQIQIPDGENWKTVHKVKNATTKTTTTLFDKIVKTNGIRIYIPAKDMPSSEDASVDGIVRIVEVLLTMPDGIEKMIKLCFWR